MIDLIQTLLLMVLVDRSILIRHRYKFAIETSKGYFAFWIYCKISNEEVYAKQGGKRLFYINF